MNYSKYVICARKYKDGAPYGTIESMLSIDNIAHAIKWMEDQIADGFWIEIQQPEKVANRGKDKKN